jgi:hypothetical protein
MLTKLVCSKDGFNQNFQNEQLAEFGKFINSVNSDSDIFPKYICTNAKYFSIFISQPKLSKGYERLCRLFYHPLSS